MQSVRYSIDEDGRLFSFGKKMQVKLVRAHGGCLALGAEEGRGEQRNASGSRKQALIRGCPNGETRLG